MEHKTASFQVSRRGGWFVAVLTAAVISLLNVDSPLQAEPRGRAEPSDRAEPSGREIASRLTKNVVQIRSRWSGKPQTGGFGFIVGERNGRLYIATANHVVRGDGPDETDRTPIVVFAQQQGASNPARLLETSSTVADLAIIEVETGGTVGNIDWVREALSVSEAAIGMEVWFVGLEREWKVPDRPGKISQVSQKRRAHYSGKTVIVDSLRVAVGTSGAPLIAKEGIVGMIVSDSSGHDAEAIPIETIEELVKEWQRPWDLMVIPPRQSCDRLAASPYDASLPNGVIGVPIDKIDTEPAALACFVAAVQYGVKVPRFYFQLGRIYEAANNREIAQNWYERAAKSGHISAQSSLGALYEQDNRESEAAELYRAAAERGDPVAQAGLGTMHREGFGGVAKDDAAAVDLYKRAAAQGYPVAISALAWMYEQGRGGLTRSESEAERLYRDAAAKGDSYALRALTRLGQ